MFLFHDIWDSSPGIALGGNNSIKAPLPFEPGKRSNASATYFGGLLDSSSTHTTPHRPRANSHLEPMPPLLEIMHWVPETEILNSDGSNTNIRVCMGLYPRSILITGGQLALFSEYMNETWSYGQLVHLHVFKAPHSAGGSHRWEQNVGGRQAGSPHSAIVYSGTERSPMFPNSILGFQDFMKVYLSKQKDRIYFISQSVNLIFNF